MELFLLQTVAFLRPIFFIEVGVTNFFDIGGIAIIIVLSAALLVRAALRKTLQLGAIDALIVAFVVWSVVSAFIYPETLDIRGLAKLVFPLLCYTIAKNIILEHKQYLRIMALMILGFILPVTASAALIVSGGGIEEYGVNYWTGLLRWEGVYAGSHSMGHNMTFLIMLLTLYVSLCHNSRAPGIPKAAMVGIMVLGALALYCLWMSQVRTALLGLLIFVCVLLYFRDRRLFVTAVLVGGVAFTALFPILKPYVFPDLVMIEQTGGGVTELGSGRLQFWFHNLTLFSALPLDRIVAGVGVGFNRLPGFIDSHNDILDLLVQAGVVGFTLFAMIQILIFRKILKLPPRDKPVFLALFIAVTLMNFVSNSYIARFGLAQMLYLILSYAEIKGRRTAEETPVHDGAVATASRG